MEIIRSQHCLKFAGSANAYLVLQVVCWHHLLLVTEDQAGSSYEATIDSWFASQTGITSSNKKLTYALISDLTGLDKETVRRNVKAHEARGWVTTSREKGICFSADEKMNSQLIELNNLERQLLAKFTSVLTRHGAAPAEAQQIVTPTS